MLIGISILNYNSTKFTISLCDIIERQIRYDYKIYIIDNNSNDENTILLNNYIETKCNHISSYFLGLNLGYARGNNIGLEKVFNDNCDYCIICNPDILFYEDSINLLIDKTIEKNLHITAPLIVNENGLIQYNHIFTPPTVINKYLTRTFLRNFNILNSVKKHLGVFSYNNNELYEIFAPSGCCFLISKHCYEKAFPLDENTFLYSEEYIIGSKLKYYGIKCYLIPNIKVIHFEKESITTKAKNYIYALKSEKYFIKKYLKFGTMLYPLILYRYFGYFIRCFYIKEYRRNFLKLLKNND